MDSELCIHGKRRAILSTLFNQKLDFNVNMNYYQTQIDGFILNSQPNQEINSQSSFQKVQFDVGDPVQLQLREIFCEFLPVPSPFFFILFLFFDTYRFQKLCFYSIGPRKPSQKLFIGNIAEGTTNEELKAVFESFAGVLEADVIKNYGFVHIDANAGRQKVNEIIRELNGYVIIYQGDLPTILRILPFFTIFQDIFIMHLTKSPDQELGQKIQICGLDGLRVIE